VCSSKATTEHVHNDFVFFFSLKRNRRTGQYACHLRATPFFSFKLNRGLWTQRWKIFERVRRKRSLSTWTLTLISQNIQTFITWFLRSTSTAHPGDHFEVTAWVHEPISNHSFHLRKKKIVPCDDFTHRRLLKPCRTNWSQQSYFHAFNSTPTTLVKQKNGVKIWIYLVTKRTYNGTSKINHLRIQSPTFHHLKVE
jgi:hypothetical protein